MQALSSRARISAPSRARASLRVSANLLDSLFGKKDMGSLASKRDGWAPSTAGGAGQQVSRSGHDITPVTAEQRQELARGLPDMARHITLDHGTERAFSGKTVNGVSHDSKQKGTYVCALGGLPLFASEAKFDSGTGWPSFYAPVDPEHIIEVVDRSIGFMPRVEVLDARTGAHLGHVFDDGPAPTGKRYCINAAALKFIPAGEPLPQESSPLGQQAGKQ